MDKNRKILLFSGDAKIPIDQCFFVVVIQNYFKMIV